MTQDDTAGSGQGNSPAGGQYTVITIPEAHVEAVAEFMDQLQREEQDVTGHMLNRGMIGGLGGTLAETISTTTSCLESITGTHGWDLTCSDTDKDRI
jgi:hypothetical protein